MKKPHLFIAAAIIIIIGIIYSVLPERTKQSLSRKWQYTDRHYMIKQYSGGKMIDSINFYGILNPEENSDGYFWFQGDTLHEVSGDLRIVSWK